MYSSDGGRFYFNGGKVNILACHCVIETNEVLVFGKDFPHFQRLTGWCYEQSMFLGEGQVNKSAEVRGCLVEYYGVRGGF